MSRILVVDDDLSVATAIAAALWAYDVVVTHNGPEALAVAAAGPPFDLVITDYLMPAMTGDEVASRLRASFPSIKTLLLTAFGEIAAIDPEGTDARLAKPFQVATLRRTVARLIGSAVLPLVWRCECGALLERNGDDRDGLQTCEFCERSYRIRPLGPRTWRVTALAQPSGYQSVVS